MSVLRGIWMQPIISFGKASAFLEPKKCRGQSPRRFQGFTKVLASPPVGYNGSYIPSSWKGYILYIVPSCTVLALRNPQQWVYMNCGVTRLKGIIVCVRDIYAIFLTSGLSTSSCNLYLCVSVSQVSLISASGDPFIWRNPREFTLFTFSGRRCPCMISSACCGTTCRFDQPRISIVQIVSIDSCFLQVCGSFRLLSRQYTSNLSTLLFTRHEVSPVASPLTLPSWRVQTFPLQSYHSPAQYLPLPDCLGNLHWTLHQQLLRMHKAVHRCLPVKMHGVHVYCTIIMTSWCRVYYYARLLNYSTIQIYATKYGLS